MQCAMYSVSFSSSSIRAWSSASCLSYQSFRAPVRVEGAKPAEQVHFAQHGDHPGANLAILAIGARKRDLVV